MSQSLSLFAPAKVNLYLHVLNRRADGYHELESLIAFADIGDRVHVAPASALSLEIRGPFASLLADEPVSDNLVLRAAQGLHERLGLPGDPGARITLEKNLPVAAGIGGGSADAAAALRLLQQFWGRDLAAHDLDSLALSLGADIPVCIKSRPTLVEGIGERLREVPSLPDAWMVLVNSGTPVPTGPVFRGLDPAAFRAEPGPALPQLAYDDADEFAAALRTMTRNDLEISALSVAPDIREVLDALHSCGGCLLGRMSGSGGTCFGLFSSQYHAEAAAQDLRQDRAGWWTAAGALLNEAPAARPEVGV